MYDNKGKICDYVTLTLDDTNEKLDGSSTVPAGNNGVYEYTIPQSAYFNHERSQAVSVSLVSGLVQTKINQTSAVIITYNSGSMNSYNNVIGTAHPQVYVTDIGYPIINTNLLYVDNAQPIEIFTQPRPTKILIGLRTALNVPITDIQVILLTLKFTYYNEQETSQNLHNQNTALLK